LELSSRIVQLLARERACLADVIVALSELRRDEGWRALGSTLLAKLAGKSEQEAELLALEYRPRSVPRDTTSTVRQQPVMPWAAPKVPAAAEPPAPARETVEHLYVIAAKREGATVRARFSGVPLPDGAVGTLLFEEPRKVTLTGQSF